MSTLTNDCPYDTGALLPWTVRGAVIKKTQKWVRVQSAFSGVGIYRRASIDSIRYDEYTDDIEHISDKTFDGMVVKKPMRMLG